MRFVPKADRAAWHTKAMEAATSANIESALELWLKAKEIDRIVARLRETSDAKLEAIGHYWTEPVAARLAKSHPDLAARVYRALGMRIVAAKKSKYYGAALSHFDQAQNCYHEAGLDSEWLGVVDQVRTNHHRKVGFMRSFEELVSGSGPSSKPLFTGSRQDALVQATLTPGAGETAGEGGCEAESVRSCFSRAPYDRLARTPPPA